MATATTDSKPRSVLSPGRGGRGFTHAHVYGYAG
ncbi:MAG: hypothetical protein QOH65_2617 [Methylobacteriaceae bacterium]|nr:hypothetical protein [Methylobacteriaceae bacterium]